MLNGQNDGMPKSNTTWVVLANRAEARVFESDGGTKNLRLLQEIPHPEGRLKNREINSDRDGQSMGEGNSSYPMGGMVNKGEAVFHETQLFARHVSELINKARTENQFKKLVLVAETRFLGELRNFLDAPTKKLVQVEVDKEWNRISESDLKSRLGEYLLAS